MTRPPIAAFPTEAYRPRIHYTAADTWINDPNGLVYADGVYHLFFQNNPQGKNWGNMSWGHAISRDLLHWKDRPLAIPCDSQEQVYSGSAVLDENNTSGLGPAGSSPLVAVYTSAYSDTSGRPGIQAQSLASSLDGGETWTKYEGNPVLDRESAHFRDPKVFRYSGPAGEYWVMATVEAMDRKVLLHRSDDLKEWTFLSEFTAATPIGTMWECPDLFPLPVEDDPATTKWVLILSLNLETGEGGSAGIHFIGDFDGATFTPDSTDNPAQPEWEWLDHGRDYYAAVSFNNAPDGRRILIGWMNNSDYSGDIPTDPWRGSMALPRELTLRRRNNRYVMCQSVVPGLEPAGPAINIGPQNIADGVYPLEIASANESFLIEATFRSGSSTEFGLVLRQSSNESTYIAYNTSSKHLILDRNSASAHHFSSSFPSRETALLALHDDKLELKIYVDAGSIEVFAQDGQKAITDQIFPHPASTGISLYSSDGTAQLVRSTITPLKATPVARRKASQ